MNADPVLCGGRDIGLDQRVRHRRRNRLSNRVVGVAPEHADNHPMTWLFTRAWPFAQQRVCVLQVVNLIEHDEVCPADTIGNTLALAVQRGPPETTIIYVKTWNRTTASGTSAKRSALTPTRSPRRPHLLTGSVSSSSDVGSTGAAVASRKTRQRFGRSPVSRGMSQRDAAAPVNKNQAT